MRDSVPMNAALLSRNRWAIDRASREQSAQTRGSTGPAVGVRSSLLRGRAGKIRPPSWPWDSLRGAYHLRFKKSRCLQARHCNIVLHRLLVPVEGSEAALPLSPNWSRYPFTPTSSGLVYDGVISEW